MSFSLAAVVGGSLCVVAVAGGVAGLCEHSRQKRRRWATQTWRDVTLRNGVTAPSPFHTPHSSFNAPGLVEVFPKSKRTSVPMPVPTPEQVPTERPREPSALLEVCNPPVTNGFNQEEELPYEPFELTDPPHQAERARVRRLYQSGMSQTKTIKAVWGLSKGGSKKYYEARRRFRLYVSDVARDSLKASIEAEGGENDA